MARSVLFSNQAVADYLSSHFECAWESVRPVPKVDIDFGNGVRLQRTLNGNIATWFCTADGRAYDVLPGLVEPDEYLGFARSAAFFHKSRLSTPFSPVGAQGAAEEVRGHHLALAAQAPGLPLGGRRDPFADRSKSRVERPLRAALLEGLGPEDVASLVEDTEYNRAHRYGSASRLLAARPLEPYGALTPALFKEVLHTDLADPFLGLAPYVLGGEGGRGIAEDAARH